MNRISRFLVATPFVLSLFVAPTLTGCAADEEADSQSAEQDLSPSTSTIVGNWITAPTINVIEAGAFGDLNLTPDGTFYAHRETEDACAQAEGIDCTALEGTWKARKYKNQIRLYLTVGGHTDRFDVNRQNDLLTLVDDQGRSQTLQRDLCSDVICAANLVCSVGECVPYPETPDAGGEAPDTEGEACGSIRCDLGTVCCNPVSEICAPPGDACAQ